MTYENHKTRFVINISGGIVQSVAATIPADVTVVDFDTGQVSQEDIVEFANGEQSSTAIIYSMSSEPLAHWIDSDCHYAMRAAGIEWSFDPQPGPFISSQEDYVCLGWHIGDVMEIRPDLSAEQARLVLRCIENTHDAEYGLSWESLEFVADDLYPLSKRGKT